MTLVGLVCTLGSAGPNQVDRYWLARFQISHDAFHPAGWTYQVLSAPPLPTPTPSPTTFPTSTPDNTATPTPSPTPRIDGPLDLVQRATMVQPSGALVFTQRCGVHGALPPEPAVPGFPGFPEDLRRLTSTMVLSGTVTDIGGSAPDVRLIDEFYVPDPLFDLYPFVGTNPSRCGIDLGTATAILEGPLAGRYFMADGVMNTATVVDMRGTDPGWSVTASVTDFVSIGAAFDGNHLGWTPYVSSEGLLTPDGYVQRVTAGPRILPGTGVFEGSGLGDGGALMASALPGEGNGLTRLDARLRLLSPVSAPAGRYTAVIVLTIV